MMTTKVRHSKRQQRKEQKIMGRWGCKNHLLRFFFSHKLAQAQVVMFTLLVFSWSFRRWNIEKGIEKSTNTI